MTGAEKGRVAMFENIREIGLFMIAAQAVIHFAPDRQYEKYIKLVSSVIILFLLIRPFISARGELKQEWQVGMEQIMQKYEEEDLWQETGKSADDTAVEQVEKEIKSRFNDVVADEEYCVNSVSLVFEKVVSKSGNDEPQLQKVEIVMAPRGKGKASPILVENIVIGKESGQENEEMASRYQEIFAGILGIEPDGVEVTCVGGW